MADPAAIEAAILDLLARQEPGRTISPMDVARSLGGDHPDGWGPLMQPLRRDMPEVSALAATLDDADRRYLESELKSDWTAARIAADIATLAGWARTHGTPGHEDDPDGPLAGVEAKLDDLLPRVKGDDDARQEFLDLLELMGPDDPRTADYRRALSRQLF